MHGLVGWRQLDNWQGQCLLHGKQIRFLVAWVLLQDGVRRLSLGIGIMINNGDC